MGTTKTIFVAAALAAAPGLASAALLDFTKDGTLSGTYKGIGYTVTGAPTAPNQNQNFDGNAALVGAPLALENDGIGIDDDEVAFAQTLTVTFDRMVTLTGVHFLDLFEAPAGASEEVAIVTGDSIPAVLTYGAFQEKRGRNPGYAFGSIAGGAMGTTFTFSAGPTNDQFGDPDYALAALQIAPIPLPAGALLLGSGLAALGFARRRKN